MTTTTTTTSAARLTRFAPVLLVLWTLFVWVGRLRNIAADDDLSGFGQAWRFALALTFVALAFWAAGARLTGRAWHTAVAALAGFTVVVWVIRGIGIAFGGHSIAFVVVHAVLAVVSIALALAAGRGLIEVT